MPSLDLIQLHFEHDEIISSLIPTISEITNLSVIVGEINHNLRSYFDPDRNQYDAAKILQRFENDLKNEKTIIITSEDLFIPIFTYVFGLAKLGGKVAIVSTHRLLNEYYGLPRDDRLLAERLVKEITHELGHLCHLRHCNDYRCVMASSNTVDDLDVKGNRFCQVCETQVMSKH